MDGEEKYLEIWKRSRDSVEHFDRILTELRKTLITVNGAALPILISLFLSPLPGKKLYIILFSLALNIVDIIFWFVEKHYHIYLVVSAGVAKKAEENLKLNEELSLTSCLGKKKLQVPFIWKYISFYDFLYLLPATVSLGVAFSIPSLKFKVYLFIILFVEIIFGVYIVNKNNKAESIS